MNRTAATRSVRLLPALLLLAGPIAAQDVSPAPDASAMQEAQQEMIRLFHEVERTLGEIDVELYDAGAGRIPVPEGRDSGMERLLQSSGSKSDQAVAGIERILELAQQLGGQGSGQCMKSALNAPPGQSGNSPLDKERQSGPTDREKTPDAPKPGEEEGQQPKPGEGEPEAQGEKPDDAGKNPPTGENRPSDPRADEGGPAVPAGIDAERWGSLPERVQQVFQNQITDDLPLQYRDWIDAYYRRLNRTR